MNNPDHKTPFFIKQIDLKFIIGGSILISVLYVILSFILFMNSGARTTISEINAGMNISDPQHSDIDTTRPINANDIDNYVSNIKTLTTSPFE